MNESLSAESLSPPENQVVAASVPDVPLEISFSQAEALLASGRYQASCGIPIDALHYRRSLADGSCLHLVVHDGRALLHNDRFDPRRDVASLLLHLATEAPVQTLESLAAVWPLLLLVAR